MIRVHGLHYLIENMEAEHSLLVVDDVFDTGRSIEAFLKELRTKTRRNMPGTVKIACPWYKPRNNRTSLKSDFVIHETDDWIVFPHEIARLTLEEIARCKNELVDILDVGYTCAYLAPPYARRLSGSTVFVDGGVNIMA